MTFTRVYLGRGGFFFPQPRILRGTWSRVGNHTLERSINQAIDSGWSRTLASCDLDAGDGVKIKKIRAMKILTLGLSPLKNLIAISF